jgi:hypothetical protein
MRRHYPTAIATFLLLVAITAQLGAQTPIPLSTPVKQNFDVTASGLALPANWKVSAAGGGSSATWATGLSDLTQASNGGSPASGGSYNWGTTAGIDRAAGFLASAGYASPNALMAYFRNTSGAAITSLTISFSIERYHVNTSGFSLEFSSSEDGAVWTNRSAGNISPGVFAPGVSGYTFNSPATITKTVTISGLNIASNADIYLRWVFTDAVAANAQGLGLDDVSVFAGTSAAVVSSTLRYSLKTDNPPVDQVNSGDELTYKTVIKNLGTGDAANVVLTEPAPTNTTFVGGSIKTSAMARDETFVIPFNTTLSGGNVLANDYGIPAPVVLSFGPTANPAATAAAGSGTSDNGGVVVLNADGTFTYTPPAGFSGKDQFRYIAGNGNLPNNDAIVTISVGAAPVATADSYNVVGNVSIAPNSASGVLSNDTGGGLVITAVNGSSANVGVALLTGGGGNLTVNADGSFSYNPAPGYTGSDNFTYTIDNGFSGPATATVTLNVAGVVWFVNNNAALNGDGRLSAPFKLITNIAGTAAGQTIFLYESATAYTGSVNLLATQKLIGQDASQSLGTITGLTPNATYSAQFPTMNSGNGTAVSLTATNANIITLNTDNTVRGITVGNAGSGKKIIGNNFGTLTLGNTAVPDVTLNGTGQALDLQTGTLAGGLTGLATTSSAAQGVLINSVAGTYNFGPTAVSGSITQGILISGSSAIVPTFGATTVSAGTDGVSIQNNTGNVTFGSLGVTTANGIGLLGSNNSGQIIVTSNTSGISATGGAAISLSQASGTSTVNLNFSGLTSTGGVNGIHLNNIAGTIAGGGGSLTGSGTVFNVNGGSVSVTYSGTLTHSAAAFYIADIKNSTGGTISLSGNLTANGSSQGLRISDTNAATITFSGLVKSLTTGANAAVTLSVNGTSNILFTGGGLAINTTSGTGMNISGGAGSIEITGAGNTIATTSGICLNMTATDASANGITFASLTTATGRLANINDSAGAKTLGRIQQTDASGSGATVALFLDDAASVSIGNAAAGTIKTTTGTGVRIANATTLNISGAGLDVTTTTGRGIDIAGSTIAAGAAGIRVVTAGGTGVHALASGTATITGSSNTVNAPGGIALNVSSGTADFTFQNVSTSGGSSNAIAYNNAAGTTTVAAGTITGNASAATFLVNGGTAGITYGGSMTQANNAELLRIEGGHQTGVITFTGTLSASNGTGLQFDNADGTYNFNGTTTLNGGDAGIDLLNGTSGTFSFGTNTTITNPTGTAFNLSGATASNATVTYSGSITDNSGFVVDIDNHDANTITFQTGNITSTANGVRIRNCGAGTINFNNPSKSLTTAANAAVTLGNNTGSTINFGTSGLVISTTSGVGFNATGGGTVNVTGTGNTIASTAGTALNLTATTIGAGGLNFVSISASGTAKGIALNGTGSGGLTVTGTGTTDGTGGTIQNMTTRGLEFISASNINLKNMNLISANNTADGGGAGACDDLVIGSCNAAIYLSGVSTISLDNVDLSGTMVENGITGLNVSNLTMNNCTINGAGDEAHESGMEVQNLSGVCSITNTNITFSETNSLDIVNTDVNLTLTIDGSTFSDTQTVSSGGGTNNNGEGGFQFRSFSSAAGIPVSNVKIKNSSFLRIRTQGIQAIAEDDSKLNIDITNCTINSFADIGAGIDINGNDNSEVNFNVIGNPVIQSRGGAGVNVTSFLDAKVMGRVNDNPSIMVNGSGAGGSGVRAVAQETSDLVIQAKNNTVTMGAANNSAPIDMQARFQTARIDITLDNNTLDADPLAVAAINIIAGSSNPDETNPRVFANIINNDIVAGGSPNVLRLRVSDLDGTTNPLMFLQGFVEGGGGIEDDAVATWNGNLNTPAATTSNIAVSLTGTATGPASGTALTPSNPLP